ncbi:unnamed protein product [Staurois parvus]|uniref:Uncharacterized protein n=1 Tax=Staurois parvus TaxID=386267 RepID=A0ABN9HVA2_9NEOB|nr:unnamed protein product [Staurois parvus]
MHTKLSMCSLPPSLHSIRRCLGDTGRRGGSGKTGSNTIFTQCRINPLGSTVSITRMLYC